MRLGSRGSALALAQAEHVADLLGTAADTEVEVVPITTSGDRGAPVGDKSRWVKELEAALLAGEIDLAVHSAKDVPTELPDGLALVAVPERVDARDALCGATSLDALPEGARVGTSSLRRAAGLRALRPDLEVVALRGNVDTRLRKLADGDCDGDRAGGRGPAAAGAAAARPAARSTRSCRRPDRGRWCWRRAPTTRSRAALAATIEDPHAAACLAAERALARALGASCNTPLGAHAVLADDGTLTLRTFLGLPDGSAWLRDELTDPLGASPEALGDEVAERMRAAGAGELLAACEALGVSNGAVPPA